METRPGSASDLDPFAATWACAVSADDVVIYHMHAVMVYA
jgi:hypothetical protein